MAIETSGAQRPTATARPYHPAPMPGARGFLDRKRHLPFSRRQGRRGYGFSTGLVAMLGLLLASFVRIRQRSTRLMALAVWALLVGASFGLPALTANRAATVVWVVAALLVHAGQLPIKRPRMTSPRRRRTPRGGW